MKQAFSDVFEKLRSMRDLGPDARVLDDLARVAGGAVNIMSGLQGQIRDEVHSRFDEMAARMDLVPRDDLARAETRIAKLEKEIEALKAAMGVEAGEVKASAKKPAQKKDDPKKDDHKKAAPKKEAAKKPAAKSTVKKVAAKKSPTKKKK